MTKEQKQAAVKKKQNRWGDPMSYSDRHVAKESLRKPNKFVCIRCLAQARTEEGISHVAGCPSNQVLVGDPA